MRTLPPEPNLMRLFTTHASRTNHACRPQLTAPSCSSVRMAAVQPPPLTRTARNGGCGPECSPCSLRSRRSPGSGIVLERRKSKKQQSAASATAAAGRGLRGARGARRIPMRWGTRPPPQGREAMALRRSRPARAHGRSRYSAARERRAPRREVGPWPAGRGGDVPAARMRSARCPCCAVSAGGARLSQAGGADARTPLALRRGGKRGASPGSARREEVPAEHPPPAGDLSGGRVSRLRCPERLPLRSVPPPPTRWGGPRPQPPPPSRRGRRLARSAALGSGGGGPVRQRAAPQSPAGVPGGPGRKRMPGLCWEVRALSAPRCPRGCRSAFGHVPGPAIAPLWDPLLRRVGLREPQIAAARLSSSRSL